MQQFLFIFGIQDLKDLHPSSTADGISGTLVKILFMEPSTCSGT